MRVWYSYAVKLIPLWLILLAPPLLFPNTTRALALVGLPILWGLQKWQKGYFVRRTPLDWPILLMLVMVLVSLYATFDIHFSLGKLTGVLLHIFIFYTVADAAQTRQGLMWAFLVYCFLGSGIAIAGLIGTEWLFKNPFISQITSKLPLLIRGLPGAESGFGPNQVAGTLLWIFPLQLSLWVYVRRRNLSQDWLFRTRFIWLFASLLSLGTLLLTQSRGGGLGAIAALFFGGAIVNKRLKQTVLGSLIVVVFGGTLIGWSKVLELLTSDPIEAAVGHFGTLNFRLAVWQASLWGIADFPFTGIGLGTFRAVMPLLYPIDVPPDFEIPHAHNMLLQIPLDLGIIGLASYLALWVSSGYMLWYVIKYSQDRLIRLVAIGTSSSLCGFFVYGLTDTIALGAKPGFFFWWLLAFVVTTFQQTLAAKQSHLSVIGLSSGPTTL